MPNKDKNIPKRRFKAFENADAWELRKLGELGTFKNGMNFSKDAMGTGFPFINLQNIFGKNVVDISQLGLAMASSIQLKNYNLQKGDVLFVRSSVKLEGVGETAIVPKNLEDTTYSGFIIRYRDSFGMDINFKRYTFGTNNIRNQIMSQATDSANKNISQQVLAELDILVPSLPEQEAIGNFFSTLDQHITLHQRKLDTLKEQKKTYLKLLFPAKGQTKPAYRFQGYTDAWELRKLGEVATHRGGTAIENYFSEEGKYKVISIGSYGLDNQYVDQNIRAVENEVTCLRVVNKNELTMVLNDKTANGNIIGRCLLIETDDEFVINQRTEIINFDNEVNPKFAYVVLNGVFREQVKKIVQGGTQIYVNYSSVEQLSFSLPTLPEQEAIGTFFSTLDSQITLHQRKSI